MQGGTASYFIARGVTQSAVAHGSRQKVRAVTIIDLLPITIIDGSGVAAGSGTAGRADPRLPPLGRGPRWWPIRSLAGRRSRAVKSQPRAEGLTSRPPGDFPTTPWGRSGLPAIQRGFFAFFFFLCFSRSFLCKHTHTQYTHTSCNQFRHTSAQRYLPDPGRARGRNDRARGRRVCVMGAPRLGARRADPGRRHRRGHAEATRSGPAHGARAGCRRSGSLGDRGGDRSAVVPPTGRVGTGPARTLRVRCGCRCRRELERLHPGPGDPDLRTHRQATGRRCGERSSPRGVGAVRAVGCHRDSNRLARSRDLHADAGRARTVGGSGCASSAR